MKLLWVTFFCLFTTIANGQKGSLKGCVKDSISGQPLPLASVTVYTANDTLLFTYQLSEPSGKFEFKGLPYHRLYRLVVSFQGYQIFRKEFELNAGKPTIDLDTIYLAEDAKALEEILISAERPPIMMRNDTLEFNANAFKTLPSAMLEDLLKKLPGVDVDLEGNIIVNGRKVNRLLVDGKEFFGSDYRIATRNLPATIVDKVQVVDDAEQKLRNPKLKAYEIGQVVNIKLKKAIRQGWFGKVYGGAGTNKRHEAGGIVNLFRDTVQISLLGFSNNVNKPGFEMNDLYKVGGINRGGNDLLNNYSTGGIQTSRGGGFNFNNEFGKELSVNLNYIYKQQNSLDEGKTFTQQFLEDTILLSPSSSKTMSIGREHKVGGSIRWKVDSSSTLEFRPDIAIGNGEDEYLTSSLTTDNFKGPVNKSSDNNFSIGKTRNYSHSLSFSTYSSGKSRRNLNISQNTSVNNHHGNSLQKGVYTFFLNTIGRDSLLNLLRANENKIINHTFDIALSQSLTEWAELQVQHQAKYSTNTDALNIYNKAAGTEEYSIYNDSLSNRATRRGWEHTSNATVSFSYKDWNFSPTLNLLWFNNDNLFNKYAPVYQRLFFAYPSFDLRWKSLGVTYGQDVQPPDARDLRPIIDISNPLYKAYGNPDLKPSVRRQMRFHFFQFFQKSQSSLSVAFGAIKEENSVLNITLLDSNRVQVSRPVTINGAGYYSIGIDYTRQFKVSKKFWLSVRSDMTGDFDKRFVSINGFFSKSKYNHGTADLRLSMNYRDLITLNQRYRLEIQQSRYADKINYRNVDLVTHQLESALIINWPKRTVWESGVNYKFNPQVGRGIRSSIVRWQASVYYAFTKDEKLQAKLSVYDILNQNVNVYRHNYEGSITDYQGTTLERYGLISFVYNIRYFSSGKKAARFSNDF